MGGRTDCRWKNKATASAGGFGATIAQLGGQIEKASRNNEPQELIAVMKEVRKVLKKMQEEEE